MFLKLSFRGVFPENNEKCSAALRRRQVKQNRWLSHDCIKTHASWVLALTKRNCKHQQLKEQQFSPDGLLWCFGGFTSSPLVHEMAQQCSWFYVPITTSFGKCLKSYFAGLKKKHNGCSNSTILQCQEKLLWEYTVSENCVATFGISKEANQLIGPCHNVCTSEGHKQNRFFDDIYRLQPSRHAGLADKEPGRLQGRKQHKQKERMQLHANTQDLFSHFFLVFLGIMFHCILQNKAPSPISPKLDASIGSQTSRTRKKLVENKSPFSHP